MFGDFSFETILKQPLRHDRGKGSSNKQTHPLDQTDKHIAIPGVAPNETHRIRHASIGSPTLQPKDLDRFVDRLLRHGTVCRPFSTSNGQKTARRNVDDMVAHETLSATSRGISNQGTQTTPRTEDITTTNLDVRRQIASYLLENPTYLVLRCARFPFNRSRCVRCARDCVPFPR